MNQQEPIEKLIARSLDGALSEDQQLELDRTVLRDPRAHRTQEDFARIDALASAALGAALPEDPPAFDPLELAATARPARRAAYHWAWWLMPGALAAALLAVIVFQPSIEPMAGSGPSLVKNTGELPSHPVPRIGQPSNSQPRADYAIHRPRQIKRNTDREIIGVIGEDGNIYWIEVDRTRTIKGPRPSSRGKLTSEEL